MQHEDKKNPISSIFEAILQRRADKFKPGPQQIAGCLLIFPVETKRLIIEIFSLITFFFLGKHSTWIISVDYRSGVKREKKGKE